ncbi:D-tyrosyl-tRNA(Tyr) deacylase [Actinomycetaceae bacterium WB03_NA08]|uniref:D-aminoacyl-tRNA deacylase n=1 Tax=Scrofimicrobium canadense TaxID=2652290 RepID=A0A6N7W795_9ACTO|nr:D-aminoacyl-tRNA deacylase [Scrofimicrobium canadense]MSS84116.1 D-tyrosyl-tRNA(Tyr) deacylase [Scrofimicrobium canadense]
MIAVLQRANGASVSVDGSVVGEFSGEGIVALVGVKRGDDKAAADLIARKIADLRILDGEVSALDASAPVMVISQFTLYGSTKKGRRPSWVDAAPGEEAEPLINRVIDGLRQRGLQVETGVFGAMMDVSLTNSGPFTVLVEA